MIEADLDVHVIFRDGSVLATGGHTADNSMAYLIFESIIGTKIGKLPEDFVPQKPKTLCDPKVIFEFYDKKSLDCAIDAFIRLMEQWGNNDIANQQYNNHI